MSGTRMGEFDEELVDINTAGELKTKTAITKLRHELQLTPDEEAATNHFYHDNGLSDDLLPLIEECIPVYKRMIEDHVRATEWEKNKDLASYIAKEKSALLDKIKAFKTTKIKKMITAHDIEYSQQCSMTQPNQYIQLTNTYFYIKKNIVVALYNAARDYYRIILKNNANNPADLATKIKHFNEKFKPVAQIDSDEILSPIDHAFQALLHLPLTTNGAINSFENAIDTLIKQCAHTGNVLGQFGDAFRCIQKRLNSLNEKEYIDPLTGSILSKMLFNPIAAPGEDTKGSLLLNLPFATTTANLGSTLKGVLIGEAKHFIFSDKTRTLDDQIYQAKLEFHSQLTVFVKYLQQIKSEAKLLLESDDADFNYDPTCDNIHAYADLLREQANIHGRIDSHTRLIHSHLKKLGPKISARMEFNRLASEHVLDMSVAALEACLFAPESDARLATIRQNLNDGITALSVQSMLIDALVTDSYEKDSMLIGDTFFHQHTIPLKTISAEIDAIAARTALLAIQIDELSEQQINATRLIDAFEIFKNCQDSLERYTLKFCNRNLSLPHIQNSTNDLFLPAITFYQSASIAYQSLESEIKNQQATILATRTYYLKSAMKEHVETLTACIDQLIRQSNQQLQEAKQFVVDSHQDTNLLLLCHLYVSALLNFPFWQNVKRFHDAGEDIQIGALKYHLPADIVALIKIVKRPEYSDWEANPIQAKALLEALQLQAKYSAKNHRVESLMAYLRQPKNSDAPINTESLYTTQQELLQFCSSNEFTWQPSLIRTKRLETIIPTPSFWERHPILKKSMMGLAIGFSVLLVSAVIISIVIATQGTAAVAIFAAFQTLILAAGSTTAAAAIVATAAAGIAAMAATIGALVGLAQLTPESSAITPDQSSLSENHATYHSSEARVLSQLGFESPRHDVDLSKKDEVVASHVRFDAVTPPDSDSDIDIELAATPDRRFDNYA